MTDLDEPNYSSEHDEDLSTDPESLNDRLTGHYEEKPFICPDCGKSFKFPSSCLRHQDKKHADLEIECKYKDCERVIGYYDHKSLYRHVKRTHKTDDRHKCFKCKKIFENARNRDIHQDKKHADPALKCGFEGCERVGFASQGSLDRHLKTHRENKPFSCPESNCGASFTKKGSLGRHLRKLHPDSNNGNDIGSPACTEHCEGKPFICLGCERSFKFLSSYRKHQDKEHADTRIKCIYENCEREVGYYDHDSLCRHVKLVHKPGYRHECFPCKTRYKNLKHLNAHRDENHADPALKCGIEGCERVGFASQASLDRHLKTHRINNPFICTESDCGASYTTKKSLGRHLRKIHPELNNGNDIGPPACTERGFGGEVIEEIRQRDPRFNIQCHYAGCKHREGFKKQELLDHHLRWVHGCPKIAHYLIDSGHATYFDVLSFNPSLEACPTDNSRSTHVEGGIETHQEISDNPMSIHNLLCE